ncbi:unnamed protein product, partial [Symbiodinium sp. KB8]
MDASTGAPCFAGGGEVPLCPPQLGPDVAVVTIAGDPVPTIACDKAGWVKIDDLLRKRQIDYNLHHTDRKAKRRQLNKRLQLLFDGNHINARQSHNAKIVCIFWESALLHLRTRMQYLNTPAGFQTIPCDAWEIKNFNFLTTGFVRGQREQQVGVFHSPDSYNFKSIMENGIVAGTEIEDSASGGRLTESGIVIVNRAIPFRRVREAWLGIPDVIHRWKFEEVEKVLDYELEDEECMSVPKSPIASEYESSRTLERLMVLLCDLPYGPHDATKERYVQRLADFVDLPPDVVEWERYEALCREAIELVIKCTVHEEQPRSHRNITLGYRIGAWTVPQREAPLEISQDDIAQAMEMTGEAQTVAEPEMELDGDDLMEEEILTYTSGLNDPSDPHGVYLLNKFRTNQLMSKLIHGAVQMGYKRDIPILPLICEMTQHRKFVQFAWQDRRQDHWPYFVFFATSYRIGTHATTTDPNSIVMLLGLGSASIALWQIFEHPTNAMAHFRTSDQCDVKFSIIGTNAMADFQTSGRMLAQIFKNRDQCYGRFANIRNLRDRLRNRVKVQDEINVEDSCMVTTVTTTIATNGVMINSGG